MRQETGRERKRIDDLEHGDITVEYGTVVHREGRKVWFSDRIVTFPSLGEEVVVERTVR